jgi:hypothetical protein
MLVQMGATNLNVGLDYDRLNRRCIAAPYQGLRCLPDEWDPPIEPHDPYGLGQPVTGNADFVSADDSS